MITVPYLPYPYNTRSFKVPRKGHLIARRYYTPPADPQA